MRINSITVDDFYINPWEVREFALRQEFAVRGNYPGQRTVSFLNDSLKQTLQAIVGPHAGNVTYWSEDQYTGSYQYTVATDRSWIHADSTTDWAGVCYLTPDAPLSSGTGLFRHKSTGRSRYDYKTEKVNTKEEEEQYSKEFRGTVKEAREQYMKDKIKAYKFIAKNIDKWWD